MCRALSDDKDLQIASLLRVSPNKFYRQGIETPEQLENGFPATRDELFAYDALIIGSVEAASLSDEQQNVIHDFVSERGGSLLMLAGPNGLGNGGLGTVEHFGCATGEAASVNNQLVFSQESGRRPDSTRRRRPDAEACGWQ